MGKNQLIAAVIIIVFITSGGLYVYLSNSSSTNPKKDEAQTNNSSNRTERKSVAQPTTADENTNASGKYTAYSSEAVAKTSGTKILFFYAPWCPQCRATEKSIKSSKLPDNLTIFKVDYDSNQALRKRYGVTIQTTFVKIDNSGNKIKSFIAYDEPTFASVKRELL